MAIATGRQIALFPYRRGAPDAAIGEWLAAAVLSGDATGGIITVTWDLSVLAAPPAGKLMYLMCVDESYAWRGDNHDQVFTFVLNTGEIIRDGTVASQWPLSWQVPVTASAVTSTASIRQGAGLPPFSGRIFRPFDDGPILRGYVSNVDAVEFRMLVRGRYFEKINGLVSAVPTTLSQASIELPAPNVTGAAPGIAGAKPIWHPGYWEY